MMSDYLPLGMDAELDHRLIVTGNLDSITLVRMLQETEASQYYGSQSRRPVASPTCCKHAWAMLYNKHSHLQRLQHNLQPL